MRTIGQSTYWGGSGGADGEFHSETLLHLEHRVVARFRTNIPVNCSCPVKTAYVNVPHARIHRY